MNKGAGCADSTHWFGLNIHSVCFCNQEQNVSSLNSAPGRLLQLLDQNTLQESFYL